LKRQRLDGLPVAAIPGIIAREANGAHGTAATDRRAVDEILGRLPSAPFILYVGALQQHKGLGTLLQAYRALDNAPPLVVIGTVWPDTPKEFPAGVTVLSNVPHQAVLGAWERCLFGVVPSIWPEPLAGTVREGMSKGKAIIGTAIGGTLDMIRDGETGLLIEPGDANGLRAAMVRLIVDDVLRERLGQAGYQHSHRYFDADIVLPQFEALYAQAIDARYGRSGQERLRATTASPVRN
jgi:glycosyltransferase involved in cell wall biosynthesis